MFLWGFGRILAFLAAVMFGLPVAFVCFYVAAKM